MKSDTVNLIVGLAIGTLFGFGLGGLFDTWLGHVEAVEKGHAHYNTKTAVFEWNTGGCAVVEKESK